MSHVENALALVGKPDDIVSHHADIDILVLFHEVTGAENNVTPFNPGADAVSHDIFHLRVVRFDQMIESGFARGLHDAVRHGVREVLFKAGRDFEEFILTPFTGRHHVREARSSLSERSGLIEYHNVSLSERLEMPTALHENVFPGSFLHGRENAERRGEPEHAAVVNEEHGCGAGEIPREEEHKAGKEEVERHNRVSQMIHPAFDSGLLTLAFINKPGDLIQAGILDRSGRTDIDLTLFNHGTRENGHSLRFADRQRFPGHR